MQLTKGAIGNLINRYKAVLKKCHLMNTFGSLAVAGMLVMGGAGMAVAGAAGGTTEPAGKSQIVINKDSENKALTGTYEGYEHEKGGVISVSNGATGVTITNSSFTGNKASAFGGAIFNDGQISITGTTFDNNIADSVGGALSSTTTQTASTNISNSVFTNNHSVYDGGAIGNYSGLKLENCLFEGNTAQLAFDAQKGWTTPVTDNTAVGGGAISLGAVSTSSVASISGTTFKNNTSGTNGGAIATRQAIHANNSAAKLDIAATFIGNKAQQGGAIYNSFYTDNGLGKGAGVTVTGTFSGNEATGKGGAIYNDGTLDKNSTKPSGGVMTITDATFDGNKADFGGAIFNSGTLTVNDGSFEGNTATKSGGAIYNATNATLKITGTSFTNNTAAGWGGAILNSGATITVTDARFENNIARGGAGGAIGNPAEGPSSVTISGTKFLNNHSVYDGGAIGNYGGMKIENCLFEGNTAQLDFDGENGTWTKSVTDSLDVGGGAISLGAVSDSAVASISGTTFKNNISGKNGGAIATRQAAHADNSAAKLDIAATFIGNKAQQGGAIYNSFYTDNGLNKGAGVTVTGTFSVNEATGKGGAIYNDGTLDKAGRKGGIMTITDATFDGNKADFGGAIFNTGTLTINGGSFEGNTATKAAGAIYNAADAKLTVDGVTFASNSSAIAGAINNSDGTVTIKNSTFKGNDAGKSMGGAVRNNSGSASEKSIITITGSTFEGNKAGNGGAVWNGSDGEVTITDSTFKGNTALVGDAQQGGAITNADQMTITGSTFEGNQAGKLGGAIYNAGALTLNNSTFTGNSATGEHAHGGAIFNAGTITFTGSNTFAGGGANDIFNAGTITVDDGTTTLDSGLSLAADSTTTVKKGGALVVNGITEWKTQGVGEGNLGSLKVDGGALTLRKDDVLEGYNTTKKDTSLSVTSGSLYLINNSNYTAENFTAAKETLLKPTTDASFGFVGGTLIDADNKATDLVVSGNMINSGTTFKDDTVLDGTKVDNSSFLENDLTVEADTTNVIIDNAAVAFNKVNIETSATGDKSLTIKSNGSLTVVGGNANDQLIAANDEDLKKIDVQAGELNLGSAAMPERGAGTLGSAEIALDSNGSLNASNGDYTVGDVTGTGKVTADAANIKATGGDITADTVTLKNNGLLAASKKDDTNGGNITISNALSGQGSVVADKTLTLTNGYTGADGSADVLTLQAGENITATNLKQADNGKLTVEAGGTITATDISATNVAAKKLAASGDVAVDGGTLKLTGTGAADASTVKSLTLTKAGISVADLTVSNDVTMTDGSAGMIDKLDAQGNVTIGKTNSDGVSLVVKEMTTQAGTTMTFDPDWGYASNNAATEKQNYDAITDSNAVNNALQVGRNSYVALGTTDQSWLPSVVQGGLREGGVETVLGLAKSLVVQSTGSIELNSDAGYVAGSVWAPAPNTAKFGANSLLVVNGANIYGDKAAIKFADASGGTLTVSEGAKLLVTDAVAGQTYTIVGNVNNPGTDLAGWKNNGMTSTTDMISLGDAVFTPGSTGTTPGKVTTSAVRNDAHTVFPNLSDGMANAVNDLYTGHAGAAGQPNWDYADVNSADMGVRFLSRATDNRFLGMDKEAAAATIESAARIAFAGAVPQMTKMASDAGTNAVVNRLGFADPADGAQAMDADGKIVDRNTTGFALWIAPLWQSQHGWGMDADSMDYGFNGNLGGVSLGADYTFENAIRAGITFNIGGGYAESSGGDLSSTDNRMNFWGLGAYAGWNYENFGVMADVSYTSTWNQLKQDVDSRMGMGDLEADVQATAISAGLRAEYLLQTSAMDIIPHIGVRYMSLNTWGYDVDTHGGTVLEGDSLHQDIWTFPIGVTFSKDFALDSGWSFKPSLDFTVIPAAGDIKAKQDVAFTGLPGTYEVETQMMDYLTWQGGVGLELGNDTMSFGVNYTLQAGQHTTGHGVFGSFRYEF